MQLLTVAASAVLFASQAAAKPTFVPLIPGSTNVKGVDSIGHINPKGGGAPNPFGEDFYKAETTWTVELCYKDSDSDGQFNGAELGDPCCEWVKDTNEKLAYTTATAPGDKSSKQDPTIWASVKCADGSSPEAKAKAFAAGGATAPAGSTGNATTTAPAANSSESATTVAPAKTTAAPAATPAPTTSGAVQLAAAASAVTVAVVAAFL